MPVPTTLWIWPCARLLGPTKGQGREIVYTLGICSFGGFCDCCLFSGRKELVVFMYHSTSLYPVGLVTYSVLYTNMSPPSKHTTHIS